ncbi:hypothetical protein C0Q70_16388 [Pomacea canaliculata]|uniref:3'-5' exoribonuclease HELZ2 OB-fold domain-containing protein n=2 Tax=Pomacea canaliculata TaxID=400727 RepID=A0A2T7NPM5_POMCA|nr:hypothetical protein C0Q70_16388 [Pomacea canaliculata]
MIKKEPRKYKRCILKIESSHKSIAKVLEKGNDAICEILINGRSKCGQSYMDDEVVVEIVNPRRAGDAPSEPVSRGGVRRDADNLAYGDVVGMYPSKRKRFKDVDHPVLFCTLDEMEDHLMKPLCKTVPKVHVLHNTIKNTDRGKVKNRVEIKRIVNGYVQSERVMKIDPEKRDLYIFRVAVLTWSHQNIYPLGAVLEVGIGGTDFSGLEVLCLQQQVRKLYPRNVVQEVDNLLAETSMLGRHDITNEKVFTIDPPGSKDLDDALSIKKEGQDFVVGVTLLTWHLSLKKVLKSTRKPRKEQSLSIRRIADHILCCQNHSVTGSAVFLQTKFVQPCLCSFILTKAESCERTKIHE